MKKNKLFSLFAALLFAGSAMADSFYFSPYVKPANIDVTKLVTADGSGNIVVTTTGETTTTSRTFTTTPTSIVDGKTTITSVGTHYKLKSSNTNNTIQFTTTAVSDIKVLFAVNSTSACSLILTNQAGTQIAKVDGTKTKLVPLTLSATDCAADTYTITAVDKEMFVFEILVAYADTKDDATLKSITVNNVEVEGFDAATTDYDVVLPFGTTEVPVVAATATSANATVSITQAEAVNGSASILVTAEDDITTKTYTVKFSVAEPSKDATLSAITVNGEALEGFTSEQLTYGIELAYGTTLIPTVAATTTDEKATYTVTYVDAEGAKTAILPCTANIEVTAEDGSTKQTYTIEFTVSNTASTDATLSDITLDGVSLAGFASATTKYTVELAYIAEVPAIEATPTHAAATVVVDAPTLAKGETGDASITVTAQDDTTIKIYTIHFTRAAAEAAKLYEVIFSNNAKGAIDVAKQTVTVPYLADTEEAVIPTTEEKNITVKGAGATAVLNESNQIVMTSADDIEIVFTIVGAPLVPKELGNEKVTFDGTEGYFFAPAGYSYTEDKPYGWVANKNAETDKPRITTGLCRMYIALPACTSALLFTGSTSSERKAQLYVNGVNKGEVTFPKQSSYTIENLNATSANFIGIENLSGSKGGDLGFVSITLTGAKEVETSFDQTQVEAKAVKVIRDGQLLIIREGKVYTAQGVELR